MVGMLMCLLLFQNDLSHSSPASSPYDLNLSGFNHGLYTLHVRAILNGEVIQEFDLSYAYGLSTLGPSVGEWNILTYPDNYFER